MVTVSKATVADNIWETIYDIINANVTDPNPADVGTRKWIFSTFPDGKVDVTSGVLSTAKGVSYPLITIEAPEMSWEKLTFKKKTVLVEMAIEVFSTSKKESITLMDDITDKIEIERPAMKLLKLIRVNLNSATNDIEFRDETKIHTRLGIFAMEFSFKGTL